VPLSSITSTRVSWTAAGQTCLFSPGSSSATWKRAVKWKVLPRLEPDAAAHHFHQPAGNRQPQAGAAITARGRAVRLGKGVEDPRLALHRDADSRVLDPEVEARPPLLFRLALHPHDLAVLGELDGIPHQVHDDLAQHTRIAHQSLRHLRSHPIVEFEALFMRPQCQGL
jgi:hypothetical protein